MLTPSEFKERYKSCIEEMQLTEYEILMGYNLYLEDPDQFHENMFNTKD